MSRPPVGERSATSRPEPGSLPGPVPGHVPGVATADPTQGADAADRRRLQGLVALVLVQFVFGMFPLFVHLAADPVRGFAPRAILVWRVVVGAAVFFPLAAWRHRAELGVTRRDLFELAIASLLGITLNMLGALEGVARTSVVHAGLLMTLIPVFTYAIALAVGQERYVLPRALGIGCALTGAAILVSRGSGDAGPLDAPVLGNLLIVGNCLAYAGYLVLARRLLARKPTLVVMGWLFLLAVPWMLPISIGVQVLPAEVSGSAWGGLAGMVGVTTVLAYLLNTYALARVSASTTAAFIYLQPLVVGATGILFRDEHPGPQAYVAALFLFLGLWLVLWRRAARVSAPQRS